MKTNTKLVIGILTAFSIIGFIVLWDLVIKENIESEEVVVLRPGTVLHPNEEITQESLFVEKRNRATLVEGYIKPSDIQKIIGKQVKQTIVGNQLISMRYIDIEDFLPDPSKGESIRPIPNQWIYALPATVRRKDRIDIYLVESEESKKSKTEVVTSTSNESKYVGTSPEQAAALEAEKKANSEEDEIYSEQRNAIASNDSSNVVSAESTHGEKQEVLDYIGERKEWLTEKGLTEETWSALVQDGNMPVLVDIPVAYAKDGAGNEILTSPEEQVNTSEQTESERLTATGAIVNLELLLSEDYHRLLLGYVNDGYQLYITYN